MAANPYLLRGAQNPETIAVSAVSAKFTTTLAVGKLYRLSATTDLWWIVAPDASATAVLHGATSGWLKAGESIDLVLDGSATTKNTVAVVRDSADGYATLVEMVGGA